MIKKRYLLTPGPTPIPEHVLSIASRPIFHHRTAEFSQVMREVSGNLRYVFQTENDVYCLNASGSGSMEAAVANLVSPEEPVLVLNGGKFGDRWAHICRVYGARVIEETVPWGEDIPPDRVEEIIKKNPQIRILFSTLSETSTGALYDVEGYSRICRDRDILLVVDGISGIGAVPCPMDQWKIDALTGSSQKSLMTPPGLSYIALSGKAWEKAEKNRSPRFYFDLRKYRENISSDTSPFTPAISLMLQQNEALRWIREITLDHLIQHHRILSCAARAAVEALGLNLLPKNPTHSLTAVRVPGGLDGDRLVKLMQTKYKTHIAGAQAPHKGEFFRIGHLGYMGAFDILTAVSALEMALTEMGYSFTAGQGIHAAQRVLQEHWE